jgi:hypothetical protein
MILLIATRYGVNDSFHFRIEPDDGAPTTTTDPVKAAKILFRLGVEQPWRMVEHAQHWGSVEIVKDSPVHH